MNEWIKILQDNDYLRLKKYLINGGDINASNESGESLLAVALRYRCDDEIIELLVDKGADLDDFNEDGVSILDYAIMYNKIELTQKILDFGIDVNFTRRGSKFTPLMGAICYGRKEIAVMLLQRGAQKNSTDSKGLDALGFAKKTHKKSMIELLENFNG